jgi:hypothetical protein
MAFRIRVIEKNNNIYQVYEDTIQKIMGYDFIKTELLFDSQKQFLPSQLQELSDHLKNYMAKPLHMVNLYTYTFTAYRSTFYEDQRNNKLMTIAHQLSELVKQRKYKSSYDIGILMDYLDQYIMEVNERYNRLISYQDLQNFLKYIAPKLVGLSISTLFSVIIVSQFKYYWPLIKEKLDKLRRKTPLQKTRPRTYRKPRPKPRRKTSKIRSI